MRSCNPVQMERMRNTTDENLNWKKHINEISTTLIKGNAMLSKLRHFVNKHILLSVYYGIFH